MTYTPDSVLFERWQKNQDADAFALLVKRYSGMVYSSCRRMLQNSSEAEDVTQECFIALMQTRDTLRLSLGAWLHTIAVRRSIDHIRKSSRRRHREHGYSETVSEEILPSDAVIKEVLVKVDEAIEMLPESLREAIVARFLEGRQHTEVAHSLGVAESTVRHRVNQAVEQVREHLKKEGVTVSIAAIVLALEKSVEAIPAAVISGICKLAVSGAVKSGIGIAVGGAAVAKLSVILAILLAALGLWKGIPFLEQSPPDNVEEAIVAAEQAHNIPQQEILTELPPEIIDGSSETTIPDISTAMNADEKDSASFSVTGRVYDAETGEGIAGAIASVVEDGYKKIESEPTSADGVYRIPPIDDGNYSISIGELSEYPDYMGSSRRMLVTVKDGAPLEGIDFPLKRGIPIRGIVKTKQGQVAPDVTVAVITSINPNRLESQSDADGNFVVYIPAADAQVMVQGRTKDYESNLISDLMVSDTGLDDLELILERQRTGSISGEVVDGDGNPLEGLIVHPYRQQPAVFSYDPDDETDRYGRFMLEGLAPGEYAVIVTPGNATGFSAAQEYARVVLDEGQIVDDVYVVYGELGGFGISGTVTDAQGKPINSAEITYYGDRMIREYSKCDGTFSITGLREGVCNLEVLHMKYGQKFINIEAGTSDVNIVLEPPASHLSIRVVDADSRQPLTRFTMSCGNGTVKNLDWRTYSMGRTVESPDGTYSGDKMRDGEYVVAVWADGYAPELRMVTVFPEVQNEVELALEMIEPAEGIVVDESNNPVSDASVYFAEASSYYPVNRGEAARTDAEGRFTLTSPLKGMSWVAAWKAGYGVGISRSPNEWRIVLPEQTVIEGVVYDNDGVMSEVNVSANYDSKIIPYQQIQTDSEGYYRITGLTPGVITLSAFPNMGGPRRTIERELHLEAGRTEEIDFVYEYGTGVVEGAFDVTVLDGKLLWMNLERQAGDYKEILRAQVDANGNYRFENVNAGEYLLQVVYRRDGEDTEEPETIEYAITLNNGETVQYDIVLSP